MDVTSLALPIIAVLVGAAVGVLGGLCGIGGGLLTIPLLGVAFGMSEQMAQGTAMLMVITNLLSGAVSYHKNHRLLWTEGLVVGVTSIPTSLFFSHYAVSMQSGPLRKAFAVFLVLLGIWTIYAWWAKRQGLQSAAIDLADKPHTPLSIAILMVLGIISGVLAGLFGIGGGIFTAAILANLMGYRQMDAQGVCLVGALPACFIGLYNYHFAHDIQWSVGMALTLGGLFTVPIGARLATRSAEWVLKNAFAGICLVSATSLWLHG